MSSKPPEERIAKLSYRQLVIIQNRQKLYSAQQLLQQLIHKDNKALRDAIEGILMAPVDTARTTKFIKDAVLALGKLSLDQDPKYYAAEIASILAAQIVAADLALTLTNNEKFLAHYEKVLHSAEFSHFSREERLGIFIKIIALIDQTESSEGFDKAAQDVLLAVRKTEDKKRLVREVLTALDQQFPDPSQLARFLRTKEYSTRYAQANRARQELKQLAESVLNETEDVTSFTSKVIGVYNTLQTGLQHTSDQHNDKLAKDRFKAQLNESLMFGSNTKPISHADANKFEPFLRSKDKKHCPAKELEPLKNYLARDTLAALNQLSDGLSFDEFREQAAKIVANTQARLTKVVNEDDPYYKKLASCIPSHGPTETLMEDLRAKKHQLEVFVADNKKNPRLAAAAKGIINALTEDLSSLHHCGTLKVRSKKAVASLNEHYQILLKDLPTKKFLFFGSTAKIDLAKNLRLYKQFLENEAPKADSSNFNMRP